MRYLRTVGRYEILREIGRGGMASVHLARQTDLDRLVALKELSAFHSSDPSFAQRFVRESRVAGLLAHPNIVTVFDFLEHEGTPYIAMEYVEGGSLRPYLTKLTLPQIAGVLEGVLSGLAHAETHGIVHRDLKPENLMVTAEGRIKIGDFGIAKATNRMQAETFATVTGMTVGTPLYMAPEQAMAQELGPWTDLYSLGCITYEMLVGRLPFEDLEAPMAILLRHVNDDIPRADAVDPDVDPGLAEWVERLVMRDPRARTQSAQQAWDELEELVIARLGARWRRDARLIAHLPLVPGQVPAPAGFDAGEGYGAPAPPAPRTTGRPVAPPARDPTADRVAPAAPHPAPDPVAAPAPRLEPAPADYDTWRPSPSLPAERVPLELPPPPTRTIPPRSHPVSAGDDHAGGGPPREPPVDSGGPAPAAEPDPAAGPPAAGREEEPFEAPLVPEFRYLHGPLVHDEDGVPLLGNQAIVEALKERLLHSRGGSFLVTGFRGVGKTTVVLRALEQLQADRDGGVDYLPIVLSVARPMTIDQLLYEIVRRLFEALMDSGVLESLTPETRDALLLAYARTSLLFKDTSSRAKESSQSLNLDVGQLGVPGALLGLVTPKVGISRKRADSLAREASFLAYSHADVEHDFLRILGLLDAATGDPGARARGFGRLRGRKPPWRGRLVVVLDELDKLTSTPEGVEAVDALLMGLKNLLTARSVHFVFVGGPELHDAFMRDVVRGNSVYESVFAYHFYVPCLWGAGDRLLSAVVDDPDRATRRRLADLVRYFDFKARGIPRLLLRELNGLVRWRDGVPAIAVGRPDAGRVAFYARLEEVVTDFVQTAVDREVWSMPIDEDRWRLGAYYITDWILRRGGTEFTVPDLLADDATPNPLMQASAHRVERLVKHLVAHRIVEELWSADAHETMLADAEQVSVYRLAPAVVRRLAQFARRNELERAELGASPAAEGGRGPIGTPWTASDSMARLKNGRYEFLELVAVGGVGRVYRAVDRRFNREVAVKVLAPHLASDEAARRRWRREAEIAIQLKHPHVVRTYDVVDDGSSALAIVMELVSGPQLRAVLPLKTPAATVVADQLLSALTYAQGVGLARFDIKPENVVFKGGTRAVIVDLGIVKRSRQDSAEFSTALSGTSIAAPLGTPAYMSPEQALGEAVDIRSDVYAVALVLYETIVGQHLRDLRGSTADVLLQVTSEPPPLTELDVSTELQAVLTRALARNPDERFSGPEEMSDALLRTPEGQAGRNLEEQELLAPRHPKPAKRRFGVMQSVRDPEAHQVT